MKIAFDPPNDGEMHEYCVRCLQETIETFVNNEGHKMNACTNCNAVDARALIIDPAIEWSVDNDGEYKHHTAGVFVFNERGEMLLFMRNKFPFGLTPPAGHVDRGERPHVSAQRELHEETAISVASDQLVHAASVNIIGDGCRRGADIHLWHAYVVRVPSSTTVKVDESEGSRPVWLTPDEALESNLTFATRYMLKHHLSDIARAL